MGAIAYVQLWEVSEDLRQSIVVVLLSELHLPHVKMANTVDLVMLMHHCGRFPLGFGQSDVDEILQGTKSNTF